MIGNVSELFKGFLRELHIVMPMSFLVVVLNGTLPENLV